VNGTPPPAKRGRFEATVSGRVQGVGFRQAACERALALGLSGHVRNTYERTVEVVAEGPEAELNVFLRWLHSGPSMAHVAHVQVRWLDAIDDYTQFEVSG